MYHFVVHRHLASLATSCLSSLLFLSPLLNLCSTEHPTIWPRTLAPSPTLLPDHIHLISFLHGIWRQRGSRLRFFNVWTRDEFAFLQPACMLEQLVLQ